MDVLKGGQNYRLWKAEASRVYVHELQWLAQNHGTAALVFKILLTT